MDTKKNLEGARSLNYKLAVTGIFGALSVILSLTPLGYIQIGLLAITVMHIPAILATLIAGLVPGMGTGLIFGLTSLIRAAVTGSSPFFVTPLVSVLPRMCFPVFVWLIYKGLSCIKCPKIIGGSIAAGLGTFIHTVLVMGAIYIIYLDQYLPKVAEKLQARGFDVASLKGFKLFAAIIGLTEATNGLWEIAGAVIITAATLSALYAVGKRKSKPSRIEQEAESSDTGSEEK